MKKYIPISIQGRSFHLPVWSYAELRRMAFAQVVNARKKENPAIPSNTGDWSYPSGTNYTGD